MYQPGRKVVISDALSHPSTHQIPDTKDLSPRFECYYTMQSIQKETQNDAELQTLLQFIMKGFPMTKDECHDAIKPYFNY